jgi:lysophospholipase L1-like esterase
MGTPWQFTVSDTLPVVRSGSASFGGATDVSARGRLIRSGAASVVGATELAARGRLVRRGSASFVGATELTAHGRPFALLRGAHAGLSLSASATLSKNPTVIEPASLGPISLHLASDLAKITKNGGNVVSAWAPTIGNLSFAQSDPSLRPTWSADVFAGKPGIVFPGPNNLLVGSGGWRVSNAAGAWTTMFIAQSLVTTPMDGVDDIQFPVASTSGVGGAKWMWIQDKGTTNEDIWQPNGTTHVSFSLGSRTGPLYCASNKVVCAISGNDPAGSGGLNSAIIRSLNTLNHSGMVSKQTALSAAGYALNETVQLGMPLSSYSKSRGEFAVMCLAAWDRLLTAAEIKAMQTYAMVRHGGAINDFLCFIGDSVTYGAATEPESYPAQLMNDPAFAASDYMNMGHSGQTITQMAAEASTYDQLARPNGLKTVILMAGLNGGNTETDTDKATAAQSAVATYKATGYKVIICTTTDGGFFLNPQYGYIVAFNNWLRANWASFADGFVDIALNPLVGVPGSHLNPVYFGDLLHPTAAGNGIIAGLVKPEVLRIQSLYS